MPLARNLRANAAKVKDYPFMIYINRFVSTSSQTNEKLFFKFQICFQNFVQKLLKRIAPRINLTKECDVEMFFFFASPVV